MEVTIDAESSFRRANDSQRLRGPPMAVDMTFVAERRAPKPWLVIVFFLWMGACGFLVAADVRAQVSPPSREFQALLSQVQEFYFAPRGLDLMRAGQQSPLLLSGALGHALRHQLQMARGDAGKLNYLRSVVEPDAARYLMGLAAQYSGTPGFLAADGRRLSAQDLLNNFGLAIQGGSDMFFEQRFGVRTTAIPPVFTGAAHPPAADQPPSAGMVIDRPPQGDSIELLGKKAPRQR